MLGRLVTEVEMESRFNLVKLQSLSKMEMKTLFGTGGSIHNLVRRKVKLM